MSISIFIDKEILPNNIMLENALGECNNIWHEIKDFVFEKYPDAKEEWNFSGQKYGWNFRIKDKKRAIIYLLPRGRYFKTAFVFGQKATDKIMNSDIAESIKTELNNARVYAEGRGIRIDIKDRALIPDIKKLIEIKIAN